MKKKLIILALTCSIFLSVDGETNEKQNNSTRNAENDYYYYECTSDTSTTNKLPLFVRIFGKKPFKFIKKSISKILGENHTIMKKFSNRSHSIEKIISKTDRTSTIFTTKNSDYITSQETYTEINISRQTHSRFGSGNKKPFAKEMSHYRKFVYTATPQRYVSPFKIRKYFTPDGSPSIQDKSNQRATINCIKRNTQQGNHEKVAGSKNTLKINTDKNIIFSSTTLLNECSTHEASNYNEQSILSQSDHNSNNGKRQRRCSVHSSSESEGYTYLLRKKRPQSSFNPYAYLTRLSKNPVFTGNYTARKYTYSRYLAFDRNKNIKTTIGTTPTKPSITLAPRSFGRIQPKFVLTTESKTTATTQRNILKTTIQPQSKKDYSITPQNTNTKVVKNNLECTENQTAPSTRAQHYWINNWNLRYMSYYMKPVEHTFRTYQPPITTFNPSSKSKTTRAMYYLTQYWNKHYFSYYTNFDPPEESFHDFAKRMGYFPDATTHFKKIRMMPKRYRPEGFIDLFSLDSFVRDMNQRLKQNQTYPPPHERDSISASVEDVSYWFFFNRSVTPGALIPGTPWKNKPRPTMKPIPSYFFKDFIITRYYPPSREEDVTKVQTVSRKFQSTFSTDKPTRPSISHTFTTTSPTIHTSSSRSSVKLLHPKTPIPTLPTNKETTAPNIDPYGLLNKIVQYNLQINQPSSGNGTKAVEQSKLHPVNLLPRFLQLPFSLNPKLMMYTDQRGKQLFTLLGKYHIHENNKTLERVRNPSEFLHPFKVVAPPPENGYYRIIQRHRIRNNDEIEEQPARRSYAINNTEGKQQLLPNDATVAVEIRFYPIHTTGTIKKWKEYLESQQNKYSLAGLPTPSLTANQLV